MFINAMFIKKQKTSFDELVADFKTNQTEIFAGNEAEAGQYVNMFATGDVSNLDNITQSLNGIKAHLSGISGFNELHEAGLESASRAALLFNDNGKSLAEQIKKGAAITGGNESFTREKMLASKDYTIALNGLIADKTNRIDQFIFPSIDAGAQFGEVTITLERYVTIGNTTHAEEGLTDWDRTHLLDSYLREGLFKDGFHQLLPVKTTTNAAKFAANYPDEEIQGYDGKKFKTNYLLPSRVKENLLTLCRAPGAADDDVMNILDRINDGVQIESILLDFGTQPETPVQSVAVSLRSLKAAKYSRHAGTTSPSQRVANLVGAVVTISLDDPKVKAHGKLTDLATLGYKSVDVAINLTANLHLHEGTFSLMEGDFEFVGLRHKTNPGNFINNTAAKVHLDASSPKFVGIKNDGSLSSKTVRLQGTRLGCHDAQFTWPLTTQAPITSEFTIDERGSVTDILEMLTVGVEIQRREAALTTLRTRFDELHAQYSGVNASLESRDSTMPATFYTARPYVEFFELPIQRLVKEQDSMQRLPNLNSALVATITDTILDAMQKTNLMPVLRTYTSNENASMEWGIVGDSMLTTYVLRDGEERTLGNADAGTEFVLKSMGVDLESFRDTLYIFPRTSSDEADRIFGFGFTLEAPSIVIDVDIMRDGGKVAVLQVHPTYSHEVSNPTVIKIEVTGAREFFKQSSIDYTHAISAE